ncbi:MAG: sulfatase-like hydrolase/transferase, partial [Gemmatimonadaceae bacterium]
MIVSRVRATLVHALYAAIIAGGLQVLIAAVRRFGMDQFIWVSRDFAWMTPIGYLILFTAAALPVAALSLAVPSRIGERLPALVFDTLAALGVILMFPRLHSLAALILAVGVGIRGAAAQPRADGHRRRARQLITATVVVLAGISVVGEVAHRRSESRALAALPAAPHGAPNVLLIILDTVRAASMSFMGYARETTPEMAKFAAGGVVFDQAYSTAPWTLPSHAGIFTARFPSSLSTDWRAPLDGRNRTLAEAMARRGYVTSGFAANHFYTSWESGLTRGFVHYEDYRRTVKQVLLSTSLLQTNFFWSVAHDHRLGHIAQQLLHLDLRTQQM